MIVEHNENGDGIIIELAPGEAFDLLQELDAEVGFCFTPNKPPLRKSPQESDRHSPILNFHEKLTHKVRDYVLGDEEVR